MNSAKSEPIAPAYIKGMRAAGKYAGVSEKIAVAWVRSGFLKPIVLSRRLHLFRLKDIEKAVELAAQAYADRSTGEGEE